MELKVQSKSKLLGDLKSIHGGISSNSVAPEAEAFIENPNQDTIKLLKAFSDIYVTKEKNGVKIKAMGVGKHAAFPEGSVNAIAILCKVLSKIQQLNQDTKVLCCHLAEVLEDYYGKALGIAYEDEITGKLTHTCGLICAANGYIEADFNIRYPVTAPRDEMKQKLYEIFENKGFTIRKYYDNFPMHVKPDSKEVELLTRICNENLGIELEPYTMGGGTYARKIPNTVGYGPGRSDRLLKWGNGHEADECVYIENLEKAIKIYIEALVELDEIVE